MYDITKIDSYQHEHQNKWIILFHTLANKHLDHMQPNFASVKRSNYIQSPHSTMFKPRRFGPSQSITIRANEQIMNIEASS